MAQYDAISLGLIPSSVSVVSFASSVGTSRSVSLILEDISSFISCCRPNNTSKNDFVWNGFRSGYS